VPEPRNVQFFKTPAELRKWFRGNHARATELWVGYYKKGSGKPSITWPESVDEALCVGWIDGIRKTVDEERYAIRFTPRKKGSIWSAVNIARMKVLSGEKRVRPEGDKAFAARLENKSGIYSYEQRQAHLEEPYAGMLKKHPAAAAFFDQQPPSYRKAISWWIVSAKREETRLARLEKLIDVSAKGKRLL
jgi:uncharacterized protein YdeI (YjbR/CyaY-like superfamily)